MFYSFKFLISTSSSSKQRFSSFHLADELLTQFQQSQARQFLFPIGPFFRVRESRVKSADQLRAFFCSLDTLSPFPIEINLPCFSLLPGLSWILELSQLRNAHIGNKD